MSLSCQDTQASGHCVKEEYAMCIAETGPANGGQTIPSESSFLLFTLSVFAPNHGTPNQLIEQIQTECHVNISRQTSIYLLFQGLQGGKYPNLLHLMLELSKLPHQEMLLYFQPYSLHVWLVLFVLFSFDHMNLYFPKAFKMHYKLIHSSGNLGEQLH